MPLFFRCEELRFSLDEGRVDELDLASARLATVELGFWDGFLEVMAGLLLMLLEVYELGGGSKSIGDSGTLVC